MRGIRRAALLVGVAALVIVLLLWGSQTGYDSPLVLS
jgi:hypothetical protein